MNITNIASMVPAIPGMSVPAAPKARKAKKPTPLYITTENKAALEEALSKVQTGRAQNDLRGAAHIIELAQVAERQLADAGLPISQRHGATFNFVGPGAWANAYRFPINSTFLTLARDKKGWHLVSLNKVPRYPKTQVVRRVAFSAHQELRFAMARVKTLTASVAKAQATSDRANLRVWTAKLVANPVMALKVKATAAANAAKELGANLEKEKAIEARWSKEVARLDAKKAAGEASNH